jgi:pimeloyl-ACP methyl ester carboxylesterase
VIVLKWLAMVVAIGYLGGLGVLYFKQRSMLFPIPPVARTAPAAAGFPEAGEHVLTTADREKVIVWHVPAKPGRDVILFFPGNGDFLAGRVSRFKGMVSDGTGLVALSYRGYAGSSGEPSERGLLQDAAAAYAFTLQRYQAARIVAWGFSLGTGVAVALAAENPVGKLILEAPYTSTVDVAASRLSIVPVSLLMRIRSIPTNALRVSAPRCWSCMATAIPRSRFPSASDCSRWPVSPNNSCGFPEQGTTISIITGRSKRHAGSSVLQKADASGGLAHSKCPDVEDEVT